ncbi:DUF3558 domain-containing protein [Actinacidiphila acidipaludis]|uniref:DUF3558 domain-containing protein n=1 Tax=Actinacidiphila acidipaludis TaxID=2873382 RepID=A0ABS7Q4W1_9ACTN|nr:DUF3558 domain-containing protein [Streptomyces acidipaludis]MBY8878195.1 DUF3558 domain-containing protein [Streptomyces acidipaludis]
MRTTRRLLSPAGSRPSAVAGMAVTAALALGALGACTTSGSSVNAATDPKSAQAGGDPTASPLPPGKYKTLPQPCTSVDLDTLKSLVPGAQDYSGSESLTYDTDRRVGCSWQAGKDKGATRSLVVDFERAVSYDPNVSDEVQAETDFEHRASKASIPPLPPGGTATPTVTGTDPVTGATSGAANGANPPDLQPRMLTDLGSDAFLNDVLKPAATGAKRTVTVVFRTANVVVSVTYADTEPPGAEAAQSADLQKGAQKVAGELEHRVER